MVSYFPLEQAPGRLFFRCEAQRATLSTEACAGMWREGNHGGIEKRATCRRCPMGAEHAGEALASLSPLRGTLTCARCHRPALRLIQGHVCVSCKNREYEVVKGANAKGTRPIKLGPLEPRRLVFIAGKALTALAMPRTIDRAELIVAALRDSSDRVRFAFRPAEPRLAQARLF